MVSFRSTDVYNDTQSNVTTSNSLGSNGKIFKNFVLNVLVESTEYLHFFTIGAMRLWRNFSPPFVMLFRELTMGLRGLFGLWFLGIPYPRFNASVGVIRYSFLLFRYGLRRLQTFL